MNAFVIELNIVCVVSADLLFLESPEVIFKVAIALLEVHQEELMRRDGFEEIMDYLKNVVPKVDADTMEAVQKKVFFFFFFFFKYII